MISLDGTFLKVEASVPKQAAGRTSGVLGDFNGADDELNDDTGNPIARNDIVGIYNKQNTCESFGLKCI